MIHFNPDYDLSDHSLILYCGKLVVATGAMPKGIIIGVNYQKELTEILSTKEWKNFNLEITVLNNLPTNMWILYNDIDAVYSNGA